MIRIILYWLLMLLIPLTLAHANQSPTASQVSTNCSTWSKNLNCTMTNQQLVDNAVDQLSTGGGGAVWGSITGTLSNQTDLQNALNGKQATGNYITALTGDGAASGPGSSAFTLATVNSNVGTFQGLTVNGKGLVTAGVNENYLTGNQNITLSGDATGSGATAINVTNTGINGAAIPRSATVIGTNSSGQITSVTTTGSGNVVLANSPTITTPAITTSAILSNNGIGSTATDGLEILNSTTAANNAQQYSPNIHLEGQGWKTNTTASSEPVDMRSYLEPIQGTSDPSSQFNIDFSTNGGSFSNEYILSSSGQISDNNGYTVFGTGSLQTGSVYATGTQVALTTGRLFNGVVSSNSYTGNGLLLINYSGTNSGVNTLLENSNASSTGDVLQLSNSGMGNALNVLSGPSTFAGIINPVGGINWNDIQSAIPAGAVNWTNITASNQSVNWGGGVQTMQQLNVGNSGTPKFTVNSSGMINEINGNTNASYTDATITLNGITTQLKNNSSSSGAMVKITGGAGTTSQGITLQTTSGNGSSDSINFLGGNGGTTTFMNMNDISGVGNIIVPALFSPANINWSAINNISPAANINWSALPSYTTQGTNWQSLEITGQQTAISSDTALYRHVSFTMSNGGSALSTGESVASQPLDFGGNLVAVYLTSSDQGSDSTTVDIWRANGSVPTSSTNSMVGSSGTKPALSSATYGKTTSFSGWTSTAVNPNDVLVINITATSTTKYLTVTLVFQQTV